jgi:hypothetical protein
MLSTAMERVDGGGGAHRPLVGADEDPALLDVPQLRYRAGGFVHEAQEPVRVVEEQLPCIGQGAVSGGPVDQPLP